MRWPSPRTDRKASVLHGSEPTESRFTRLSFARRSGSAMQQQQPCQRLRRSVLLPAVMCYTAWLLMDLLLPNYVVMHALLNGSRRAGG